MRKGDSNPSIDRIIEEAIESDLKLRPDYFFTQRVMTNIYSIYNSNNLSANIALEKNHRYSNLVYYSLSIAASVFAGYIIGGMYVSPTTSNMLLVSFENISVNILAI